MILGDYRGFRSKPTYTSDRYTKSTQEAIYGQKRTPALLYPPSFHISDK